MSNDKEIPRCDITFAYEFDEADTFKTPAEELNVQLPLKVLNNEKQIGKADGLSKVQEFLPFSSTDLDEFLAISEIENPYQDLTPEDIESKF